MFARSLVVVLALVNFARPDRAVPITKCTSADTKCLKQNTEALVPFFAAGIPELGVERMDPLFFKKIDAGNKGLTLLFDDITLTGLKTCRFKKISRDAAKQVLSAKLYCDVQVDGLYEMSGTVLVLPIVGKGKVHIEHKKVEITFDLSYKEETGADGKTHWSLGDWKHTFDYKGDTKMDFTNLFNGNEVLAGAAQELMRTNPNVIAKETAGPMIKTIVGRIIKNLKAFFDHLPVEDVALD